MHAFLIDLPNRPGSLAEVAEAIAARGINITGFAGATAGASGAVAITTDDDAGTRAALDGAGYRYRTVAVVTAALEHRPGTLAAAARRLADAGVNLETAFAAGMDGERVVVAFGVSDATAAERALG